MMMNQCLSDNLLHINWNLFQNEGYNTHSVVHQLNAEPQVHLRPLHQNPWQHNINLPPQENMHRGWTDRQQYYYNNYHERDDRPHRRRRSHLDDIYLPNYDDDEDADDIFQRESENHERYNGRSNSNRWSRNFPYRRYEDKRRNYHNNIIPPRRSLVCPKPSENKENTSSSKETNENAAKEQNSSIKKEDSESNLDEKENLKYNIGSSDVKSEIDSEKILENPIESENIKNGNNDHSVISHSKGCSINLTDCHGEGDASKIDETRDETSGESGKTADIEADKDINESTATLDKIINACSETSNVKPEGNNSVIEDQKVKVNKENDERAHNKKEHNTQSSENDNKSKMCHVELKDIQKATLGTDKSVDNTLCDITRTMNSEDISSGLSSSNLNLTELEEIMDVSDVSEASSNSQIKSHTSSSNEDSFTFEKQNLEQDKSDLAQMLPPIFPVWESSSNPYSAKIQNPYASFREIDSDEETVCFDDFISIDKINTTSSYLPKDDEDDELDIRDDYRVVDMVLGTPSPKKRPESNTEINSPPKRRKLDIYEDINSDKLLSEINQFLEEDKQNSNDSEKRRMKRYRSKSLDLEASGKLNNLKPSRSLNSVDDSQNVNFDLQTNLLFLLNNHNNIGQQIVCQARHSLKRKRTVSKLGDNDQPKVVLKIEHKIDKGEIEDVSCNEKKIEKVSCSKNRLQEVSGSEMRIEEDLDNHNNIDQQIVCPTRHSLTRERTVSKLGDNDQPQVELKAEHKIDKDEIVEVDYNEKKIEEVDCSKKQIQKVSCSEMKIDEVSCGEEKIVDESCSDKEIEEVNSGENKIEKETCSEKKVEKVNCSERKTDAVSCGEENIEEICNEKEDEERNIEENKIEAVNCNENKIEVVTASSEKKIEEMSCNEKKIEDISCNDKNIEELNYSETKIEKHSFGEKIIEDVSCSEEKTVEINCRERKVMEKNYNEKEIEIVENSGENKVEIVNSGDKTFEKLSCTESTVQKVNFRETNVEEVTCSDRKIENVSCSEKKTEKVSSGDKKIEEICFNDREVEKQTCDEMKIRKVNCSEKKIKDKNCNENVIRKKDHSRKDQISDKSHNTNSNLKHLKESSTKIKNCVSRKDKGKSHMLSNKTSKYRNDMTSNSKLALESVSRSRFLKPEDYKRSLSVIEQSTQTKTVEPLSKMTSKIKARRSTYSNGIDFHMRELQYKLFGSDSDSDFEDQGIKKNISKVESIKHQSKKRKCEKEHEKQTASKKLFSESRHKKSDIKPKVEGHCSQARRQSLPTSTNKNHTTPQRTSRHSTDERSKERYGGTYSKHNRHVKHPSSNEVKLKNHSKRHEEDNKKVENIVKCKTSDEDLNQNQISKTKIEKQANFKLKMSDTDEIKMDSKNVVHNICLNKDKVKNHSSENHLKACIGNDDNETLPINNSDNNNHLSLEPQKQNSSVIEDLAKTVAKCTKTPVISFDAEFFLKCVQLPIDRFPPLQKIERYSIVENDCCDKAVVLEAPEIKNKTSINKTLLKKSRKQTVNSHIEATDDIIEIKPDIPIIDLTDEGEKVEKAIVNDNIKNEVLKTDKKEKVDLENTKNPDETITLYRSDETISDSLDVQATVVSLSSHVLNKNKTSLIGKDSPKSITGNLTDDTISSESVGEANKVVQPQINTQQVSSITNTSSVQEISTLVNPNENICTYQPRPRQKIAMNIEKLRQEAGLNCANKNSQSNVQPFEHMLGRNDIICASLEDKAINEDHLQKIAMNIEKLTQEAGLKCANTNSQSNVQPFEHMLIRNDIICASLVDKAINEAIKERQKRNSELHNTNGNNNIQVSSLTQTANFTTGYSNTSVSLPNSTVMDPISNSLNNGSTIETPNITNIINEQSPVNGPRTVSSTVQNPVGVANTNTHAVINAIANNQRQIETILSQVRRSSVDNGQILPLNGTNYANNEPNLGSNLYNAPLPSLQDISQYEINVISGILKTYVIYFNGLKNAEMAYKNEIKKMSELLPPNILKSEEQRFNNYNKAQFDVISIDLSRHLLKLNINTAYTSVNFQINKIFEITFTSLKTFLPNLTISKMYLVLEVMMRPQDEKYKASPFFREFYKAIIHIKGELHGRGLQNVRTQNTNARTLLSEDQRNLLLKQIKQFKEICMTTKLIEYQEKQRSICVQQQLVQRASSRRKSQDGTYSSPFRSSGFMNLPQTQTIQNMKTHSSTRRESLASQPLPQVQIPASLNKTVGKNIQGSSVQKTNISKESGDSFLRQQRLFANKDIKATGERIFEGRVQPLLDYWRRAERENCVVEKPNSVIDLTDDMVGSQNISFPSKQANDDVSYESETLKRLLTNNPGLPNISSYMRKHSSMLAFNSVSGNINRNVSNNAVANTSTAEPNDSFAIRLPFTQPRDEIPSNIMTNVAAPSSSSSSTTEVTHKSPVKQTEARKVTTSNVKTPNYSSTNEVAHKMSVALSPREVTPSNTIANVKTPSSSLSSTAEVAHKQTRGDITPSNPIPKVKTSSSLSSTTAVTYKQTRGDITPKPISKVKTPSSSTSATIEVTHNPPVLLTLLTSQNITPSKPIPKVKTPKSSTSEVVYKSPMHSIHSPNPTSVYNSPNYSNTAHTYTVPLTGEGVAQITVPNVADISPGPSFVYTPILTNTTKKSCETNSPSVLLNSKCPSTSSETRVTETASPSGSKTDNDDISDEGKSSDSMEVKVEYKSLLSPNEVISIDLTWMDAIDNEELQNEIELVSVKNEEPAENDNNALQEPLVAPSPADSGISSPPWQMEYNEEVFSNRTCICGKPAFYVCGCVMAMYCSVTCQIDDWQAHKEVCVKHNTKSRDGNQN